MKQPQALPYDSVVVGARAVAAKDEAELQSLLNSGFLESCKEESSIESLMISWKNKPWVGWDLSEPESDDGGTDIELYREVDAMGSVSDPKQLLG